MKNYDDFKEFYGEEIFAELLVLDSIRRGILLKCYVVTILSILLAGLAPMFLPTEESEIILLILVFWAMCSGLWFLAIRYFTKDYRWNFKSMIIEPLIKFIDPNLQYAPEGSVDLIIFRRAEIFERYVNIFDGEDLVSGKIDKTKIQFSEVYAQYQDDESGDSTLSSVAHALSYRNPLITLWVLMRKQKHKVFKGFFFAADFHKTFHGKILVIPDKAEKYFGRFGSMLQSHNFIRGELMKMDNAEFEKHFAVYGTDQIQARYVLTPQIMDKILELRKKTGAAICLSFKDSMLYIAVPCRENKFEPPYFKSLVNYFDAHRYFQDLTQFVGIVEEFNLNTRIWTKE